jgi:EAL domain-containing protein (putative c-di-GMP-specific phosphodiesterase class I)
MSVSGQGESKHLLKSWLDLASMIEQQPELRTMFYDHVTGLPTTPLLFPRIAALLEDRGEVTLLCVNVVRYSRIEEIYGWRVFDDVMRDAAEALDEIAGDGLRDTDMIAELMTSGNTFVIVLSPPRLSVSLESEFRIEVSRRVESRIREKLAAKVDPALFKKFGCYVGASTICQDDSVRLERLVYEGLQEALADSHGRQTDDADDRRSRLRVILDEESIRTLVHPILDLDSMDIIGYEALSRGPEGSEFERPDKLFAVAYDEDLVLRLERVCRKRALEMAAGIPEGRLLFLNIEPEAVADPHLRDVVTGEGALTRGLIVLEVTESAAVADFTSFRGALDYVRALGFKVAIDNAGAGYGSISCVSELHPEWIKVDRALVSGCDSDDIRRSLIESLVTLSARTGSKLIAEGIETVGELNAVRALGVRYGQGFLLAEPSPSFPEPRDIPAWQYAKGDR